MDLFFQLNLYLPARFPSKRIIFKFVVKILAAKIEKKKLKGECGGKGEGVGWGMGLNCHSMVHWLKKTSFCWFCDFFFLKEIFWEFSESCHLHLHHRHLEAFLHQIQDTNCPVGLLET